MLNFVEIPFRVDVVEVEDFLERLQCFVGGFLEDAIAIAAQIRIDIGGAFFEQLTDAGLAHHAIALDDFQAALELPFDADLLADEEERDAKHRLAYFRASGI